MDEIKNKIKAIIFDMDGTIVDTEQAWRNVTIDVLKARGIETLSPQQEKFLETLSGKGLAHAVVALKDFFGLEHSFDEILRHKLELANFHLTQNINFIHGFEAFHKKLQANNIPTSIATNASPENLQCIANQMQLESFFGNNIYCIADVGNRAKPDPALFLHAAEKLGVKPSECIVFEDSIYGFQAAKAAGMRCIAIKNHLNQHILDQVHDFIESYTQAEDKLRKL